MREDWEVSLIRGADQGAPTFTNLFYLGVVVHHAKGFELKEPRRVTICSQLSSPF